MSDEKYTIMVEVSEGSDEYWEAIIDRSGADDITEEIRRVISDSGFTYPETKVTLVKFENVDP
jgi:hypothetical protein